MVLIENVTGDIPSDILELVKTAAEKENFKEISLTKVGHSQNDGYIGVMSFIAIDGKTTNGMEKTLDVAVKASSKTEKLRKDVNVNILFLREVAMYTKVFPAFSSFRAGFNLPDSFDSTTKCYHGNDEDMQEGLVFPNLRKLGFDLCDRNKPMDDDHVVLVLNEYAKFHAISLVMKKENNTLFDEISKDFCDIFLKAMNMMMPVFQSNLDEVIGFYEGEDVEEEDERKDKNKLIADSLKKLKEDLPEFLQYVGNHIDEFSAILHGDSWCNNMMFRYEDHKPVELKLLDFQMSKVGSIAVDLSYFLYSCCPGDFNRYIYDVYYKALSGQLQAFGKDPEKLYPRAKLTEEWRKFARLGLIMSFIICRIAYAEKGELVVEQGDAKSAMEVKPIKNMRLFKQKIRSNVRHLFEEHGL